MDVEKRIRRLEAEVRKLKLNLILIGVAVCLYIVAAIIAAQH